VLSLAEAPDHPHLAARGTFVEVEGVRQPGPAPRFSRTPGRIERLGVQPGEGGDAALADWGFADDERARLREAGAIA
jgi:alpha-methylacyl-CoA racemase